LRKPAQDVPKIAFIKIKKSRPPYRFLPVALSRWYAVERGILLQTSKTFDAKKAGGRRFFLWYFLSSKERKYIYNKKIPAEKNDRLLIKEKKTLINLAFHK